MLLSAFFVLLLLAIPLWPRLLAAEPAAAPAPAVESEPASAADDDDAKDDRLPLAVGVAEDAAAEDDDEIAAVAFGGLVTAKLARR